MNKIDEDLGQTFIQIYNLSHLEEMSVHCKPGDMEYNFTITVGSSPYKNTSNGSRIEHNPPHAHIFIGHDFSSRFIITDENPPQKKEDLKTVDESDASLLKIGDKLIEWINAEPIRSFSKGNKTNWDAMRSAWIDIQDIVNQGQIYDKTHLEEMANCRPNKTGLPMNIWIDETSAYLNGGLAKRIKFQINKNPLFQTSNSCPMLLDGNIPEKVFDMVKNNKEYKLTKNDIEMVSNFVKNNSYALSLIADQKVWIDDFWGFCIKGGEIASEEEIELLKQKCNAAVH